jgi:hypothetical protein
LEGDRFRGDTQGLDETINSRFHLAVEPGPGQGPEAVGGAAGALVHEAFVRLVDQDQVQHWDNRRHFFAAAEAMRRILIERARARRTEKRGGLAQRVDLETLDLAADERCDEILALDEALAELQPTMRRLRNW